MGKFKTNKDKALAYWRRYLFLDEIKRICKFTKDTRVLDVGCGISTVLHFVGGERYGIDPLADEYLKMYQYPKGITIQQGLGEEIPFPDGFFDVVFCSNVLDHTNNPSKVVKEVSRVLKNKGYFILTVHIFKKSFKRDPSHPYTFTKQATRSLIRSRFRVILERESPAVGLYRYVAEGKRKSNNKELILVLGKRAMNKP